MSQTITEKIREGQGLLHPADYFEPNIATLSGGSASSEPAAVVGNMTSSETNTMTYTGGSASTDYDITKVEQEIIDTTNLLNQVEIDLLNGIISSNRAARLSEQYKNTIEYLEYTARRLLKG